MEVDWNSTLGIWRPSGGAQKVAGKGKIENIARFCDYVGNNFWDKIEYFGAGILEAKRIIDCGLSKNDVFSLASTQICQHLSVWEVRQGMYPSRLTYEFPFFAEGGAYMMYMKFQLKEGYKGLSSPQKVKKVWLDFHTSDQKIEVIYVQD